jgi:hypothetical protein
MITRGMGKNQRLITKGMVGRGIIPKIIKAAISFKRALQARIFKHEEI